MPVLSCLLVLPYTAMFWQPHTGGTVSSKYRTTACTACLTWSHFVLTHSPLSPKWAWCSCYIRKSFDPLCLFLCMGVHCTCVAICVCVCVAALPPPLCVWPLRAHLPCLCVCAGGGAPCPHLRSAFKCLYLTPPALSVCVWGGAALAPPALSELLWPHVPRPACLCVCLLLP